MSRGFVREGDQEEPPVISQRAVLPPGVVNYVTGVGMQALLEEREALQKERSQIDIEDERERRREITVLEGKMALLQERIHSARLLEKHDQPEDEIRFGATVTVAMLPGRMQQTFTITGVDEANVALKKLSFLAPISRAVTGKKAGDTVSFSVGPETRSLQIISFHYT